MKQNALVIDDERDIGALVCLHLRDLGLNAHQCLDGAYGLQRALREKWSLIVLDLSLPKLDGIEICRRLRERRIFTPILMLTARDSELERAHGLDMGADDYLSKPFGIVELLARAKALLRRAQQFNGDSATDRIRIGAVEIDLRNRQAVRGSDSLALTAREFDLLAYLAAHRGRVFTRAQLLDQVWGSGHDAYEHAVSSHINRLRAKLEQDPQAPKYLVTVWGVGYRFENPIDHL